MYSDKELEMQNNDSVLPEIGPITNNQKFVFIRKDWIEVNDLLKYGFDDEIINGFIKYDIFPGVLKYKGKYYVPKYAIMSIINTLLKNSIKIYEMNEKLEQEKASIEEQINKDQELLHTDEAI